MQGDSEHSKISEAANILHVGTLQFGSWHILTAILRTFLPGWLIIA